MPCGPQLIEAVAACLPIDGATSTEIQDILGSSQASRRAIRYAISELIKQGRAKRKGQQGPVYAVMRDVGGQR